mmetsp:Transcript_19135/g.28337  ORF Transcript_19135/g.28337 Transcript_19135/m.28337 type:complete len:467 (-) Transcript_19135:373-1773(-)
MAGEIINGASIPKGAVMYEETTDEAARIPNSIPTKESSFDVEDDDGLEMVPVGVIGTRGYNSTGLDDDDDDFKDERPSNERLLCTAFFTFLSFTICQSVAAYIAGSEAMMGDSAAMFVDALTYLFNLIAERRKSRFEEFYQEMETVEDPIRRKKIKQRARRKMVLRLEIVPPIVSVTTLVIVTTFVLKESITVLQLDTHRSRSEQGDPNVNLMLAFSCANLFLDLFNVCCFAGAQRLFGYETTPKRKVPGGMNEPLSLQNYAQVSSDALDDSGISNDNYDNGEKTILTPQERLQIMNGALNEDIFDDEEAFELSTEQSDDKFEDENISSNDTPKPALKASRKNEPIFKEKLQSNEDVDSQDYADDDESQGIIEEANLNMCSAYTHVFADTLRSIAVIVAALMAEFADSVTSEEADATAAVAVSILILVSLLPLFKGLMASVSELLTIHAEERDEKIVAEENHKTIT